MARTQGWLLAFTESGHLHFIPVLDVPEGARASRGQSIYGLTQAERSDVIVTMLPADDLTSEHFVVFLTKNGLMKRTKLSEFANPRAGGVIAAGLKKGDRIMDVRISDGEGEVMIGGRRGGGRFLNGLSLRCLKTSSFVILPPFPVPLLNVM